MSIEDVELDRYGLLRYTTRFVVVAYLVLLVASTIAGRDRFGLDLAPLYFVAIGLLALRLSTADSCRVVRLTGLAAFIGVVLVTLNGLVGVVGRPYDFQLTLLVVVLAAAAVVNRNRVGATPTGTAAPMRQGVVTIGLGVVVLLAAALYFYRLGGYHLLDDEYFAFDTAYGVLRTGGLRQWDWIASEPGARYPRAWPHTLLVAVSFAAFGVSEWSARLVSAVLGVLTVPTIFFVVRYFTARRDVALATALAVVLLPNIVSYFRWTRMYALLISVFAILTYLSFRVLTEENPVDLRFGPADRLVERHLNFNFPLGVLTLLVFYVAYQIHRNALLVLVIGFAFVAFKWVTTGERRYLTATVLGLAGVGSVAFVFAYTPYLDEVATLLSFFERRNYDYVTYLFQFPLPVPLGSLLFAAGAAMVATVGDGPRRDRLLFLYLLCLLSIVFYVFVGDRYVAYAYVVHVVPFAMALVLFAYFEFTRAIDVPLASSVLSVLLVASMVQAGFTGSLEYDNPYGSAYPDFYADDPVDFTTAYGTIERDFDPERDVIVAFALRDYYLRDLPENATVIDVTDRDDRSVDLFREYVRRWESGWITWPSGKAHHIDPEIRRYLDENFDKRHGRGVDDTNVEVYYFDTRMVNGTAPADYAGNETAGDNEAPLSAHQDPS